MSMKHFQFVSHFIEFDIRETPKQRWKHDKFACVRHIFDVNCKFGKGRNPSPFQEILDIYLSSSITRKNLLNTDFCGACYAMLVFHTLIIAYHTLESLT